jgi:hypothetical protein
MQGLVGKVIYDKKKVSKTTGKLLVRLVITEQMFDRRVSYGNGHYIYGEYRLYGSFPFIDFGDMKLQTFSNDKADLVKRAARILRVNN